MEGLGFQINFTYLGFYFLCILLDFNYNLLHVGDAVLVQLYSWLCFQIFLVVFERD